MALRTKGLAAVGIVAGASFACGAASLILEVLWARYLGLLLGVSAHAIATVLTCFMLGLALGNWYVGRRLDRGAPVVPTLVLLQLVLAGYMLASPWLYEVLWSLSRRILPGTPEHVAGSLRIVLSLAALLPPAVCIGGTFPALIRWGWPAGNPGHTALAGLYALYTLGGVLGAWLAGPVLMRHVGMRAGLWVAAAMTLLAAACAWLVPAPFRGHEPDAESATRSLAPQTDDVAMPLRWIALGVCGISGFTALAHQVLSTRIVTLFFRDTVYDFAIVLAVFLTGIALGSLACRSLLRRARAGAHALGWVQLALAAFALLGLHLVAALPWLLNDLQTHRAVFEQYGPRYWTAAMAIRIGYAMLVLLPMACLFGAAFPLAARLWIRPAEGKPAGVGSLTAVNTLGATLGSLVAGFALIPAVGTYRAVLIVAALNAVAGCAMLLALWRRHRGFLIAGVVSLTMLLMAAGPGWNRHRMSAGFLDQSQPVEQLVDLVFYHEDAAGITSVVELVPLRQKYLVTNRLYGQNTSDLGGLQDHRRLGWIPMLLHPHPRRVLAVGLGAGITLRGILSAGPEEVEVAEIMAGVVTAAGHFAYENQRALEDHRVRVFPRDGRNHLAASARPFDVIILDILHPMSSGSAGVFSREYYALCRDRLAPGGRVCQWLPVHQLSGENLRTLVRTFQSVFPHATAWYGLTGDTAVIGLIGGSEPLSIDAADLAGRYRQADEATLRELREINLGSAHLLLSHFIADASGLARFSADARIDTDDLPIIAFEAPRLAVSAARQGKLNLVALADCSESVAGVLHRSDGLDQAALDRFVAAKRTIIEGVRLELAGDAAGKMTLYHAALQRDPANEDLREVTRDAPDPRHRGAGNP